MPASSASARKPLADIEKTAARRFPLVHQLIHFADLRNFYRSMTRPRSGAAASRAKPGTNSGGPLVEDVPWLQRHRPNAERH